MYNPEEQQHQQQHQLMAPRMSFSSDFALEPPSPPPGRAPAGDADFEFSVGGRPMMAADQLFSKGRMLPLREAAAAATGGAAAVTLRDELRARDSGGRPRRAARAPAPAARWKELLGLRKAHRKGAVEEGASADALMDLGDHGETVK